MTMLGAGLREVGTMPGPACSKDDRGRGRWGRGSWGWVMNRAVVGGASEVGTRSYVCVERVHR